MKTKITFLQRWKLLFLLCAILCSYDAYSSHFRGGSLNWRCTNGGADIEYTIILHWQKETTNNGYFYFKPGQGSTQLTIQEVSGMVLEDTPDYITRAYTVVLPMNSINYTGATITRYYRFSSLANGWGNDIFYLYANVHDKDCSNEPPVISNPPTIFNVLPGNTQTCINLTAVDPDGDDFTFSIAPSAYSGLDPSPNWPTGTLSSDGLLCINPTTAPGAPAGGYPDGTYFPMPIRVVDDNYNSTAIDILVKVQGLTGVAPQYDYTVTPTDGSTLDFYVGSPGSFVIKATDADSGDDVSIVASGIPSGGSFSPALPNASNPNETTFSWTPTAADVGTYTIGFVASDGTGQQTPLALTLNVCAAPTANCLTGLSFDLDANGALTLTPSDIDDNSVAPCGLQSMTVTPNTFGCADVGTPTVTLRVTDTNGSFDECTTTITIEDNMAPQVICDQNNSATLDAVTGTITVAASTFDDGSYDNCGITKWTYDAAGLEETKVYDCDDVTGYTDPFIQEPLYVWDAAGNSSVCNGGIRIFDSTAPTCVIKPNIEVELDQNGNGTLTVADVDDGTYDICGIASLSLSDTDFDCTDVGVQSITLIATDVNGNISNCPVDITVLDNVEPTALCKAFTLQLDANGDGTLLASDIDDGSNDACGIQSLSVSQSTFDCSHVGDNTVTLTVTDVNGNSSTCDATVTVEDKIDPTAICKYFTLQLDANGDGTLSPSDIDDGSNDACGIQGMTVSQTAFDCSHVGPNIVILTVTDVNGNTSTCDATVTVEDNVDPQISCVDIAVELDATGNAMITGEMIAGSVSVGNSSVVGGDNGSDSNGETFYTVMITTPITLNLNWAYTTMDVDGAFFDRFGYRLNGIFTQLSNNDGSNMQSGSFSVTLNPGDEFGAQMNTADNLEGSAKGTMFGFDLVGDFDPSNWTLTNVNADGFGFTTSGSSFDACGIDSYSVDISHFDCTDVGVNTVEVTVTDVNNNSSTCTSTVTVIDNVDPTAICKDFTLQLDVSGNGTLSPSDIDDGSNDACGIQGMTVSQSAFDCSHVGANTVTLTVTDVNGNSSTCDATVTVEDNVDPTAICKDFTLQLDASGNVTLLPSDIDDGSNDACGIDPNGFSVSQSAFDCSHVGPNTVTLTVTDVNGNTATCDATVTVEDNVDPTAICKDIDLILNGFTGQGTVEAIDIDDGSNDACGIASYEIRREYNSFLGPYWGSWSSEVDFDCDNIGGNNVQLRVTDVNGNTDVCSSTVTVIDDSSPFMNCQDDIHVSLNSDGEGVIVGPNLLAWLGIYDPCGIDEILVDGQAIKQYTCDDLGGPYMVMVEASDFSGNTTTCMVQVYVEDKENPECVPMDITVQLDSDGNASIAGADIDGGSTDNCTIISRTASPNAFTCADVGPNTVTLTVTDQSGNFSTCDATVTVEDNVDPEAICKAFTLQLDANGNGTLLPTDIDDGSNDACGIQSLAVSQSAFDCSHVGTNTVTLTVTDNNGNISTCDATVTVEDNVNPVAVCQDITLQLDAAGNASITNLADLDGGSTDACGIDPNGYSATQTTFDCSHVGTNTVTLTVTDVNGNTSTCDATVTVEDNVDPTAICKGFTLQLDASGNGTLLASDIDDGSNDACGIQGMTVSQTDFDCSHVGVNTVTLTVTDVNGNSSTCDATVTVEDNVDPTAICKDFTLQLDASGNGILSPSDIDDGSNDACGIQSLSVSQSAFDCSHVGANIVTLTVTDNNGNTSTCDATVTVEDNVDPTALCKDFTLELDNDGNGTLTGADIDDGSNDACGIQSLSVSQSSFDCSHLGPNTVTLTVTDNNGNTSTCDATVTVEDNIDPVAICKNITIQLNLGGVASIVPTDIDDGSTDNCSLDYTSFTVSQSDFNCSHVGDNTVTLTVYDQSGNSSTCDATVTVEDNVSPLVNCVNNIEVPINSDGIGFASIIEVTGATFDACGVVDTVIIGDGQGMHWEGDAVFYDCSDLGYQDVTIRITDINGNVEECNTQVLVKDEIAPTVVCTTATLYLDNNGEVTLDPMDIDGGSTDNCSIVSWTADRTAFDCDDVGIQMVMLTVTDQSGNSSTCATAVQIIDDIPPVVTCQDITLALDANGMATITGDDVAASATDACGVTLSVSPNSFDCSHVGINSVTLTATDDNGNSETCTAQVYVQDNTAPDAVCQDITLQLDATGVASIINLADLDGGSTDACGIDPNGYSASQTFFDCSHVGTNTVTLTVTDVNGNSSTCDATVTVEDNVAPVVVCQDLTLKLDADGNASITNPADLDGGSLDACGLDPNGYSLSQTDFDCTHVGTNTVILTVTDVNGNSATCDATVTVEDNVDPEALCKSFTLQLDANGSATLVASDIDDGSNDACGIQGMTVSQSAFDCSHIGANTVTLTVTDNNGNTATCDATVTVEDDVAPVASCTDILVSLDNNGEAVVSATLADNGSSDNCTASGDLTYSLTPNTFDCTHVGMTGLTAVLTVTDESGNSSTCTANVVVEDNIAPTPSCVNITVGLDENGEADILPSQIDGGSTDNCTDVTLSLDKTHFECSDIGDNTVILTATDDYGNAATCTATVTVVDLIGPEMNCPDDITMFSLITDCNQNVVLPDLAPTDVCTGVVTNWSYTAPGVTLIPSTGNTVFGLFPVGSTEVTATGTDGYGNTSSCSFNVIIIDNVDPTISGCEDVVPTITYIDGTCTAAVTWDESLIQGNDNCEGYLSGVQLTSDYDSGDNFPAGVTTTVTYTATDASGNSASCSFDVTIAEPAVTADYTFEPLGLGVEFTNTSSGAVSYSWDFGDGSTSSDENPIYSYAAGGTYTVCLTATNACGTTDISCQDVSVFETAGLCLDVVGLDASWSLISFDVMPSNPSLSAVFGSELAGSDPNITDIITFDGTEGAQTYSSDLPPFFPGQLSTIEAHKGYWVRAQNPTNITLYGTCMDASERPALTEGWNLTAYVPQASESPSSYFADIMAELEFISGYDNGSLIYNPAIPFGNSLVNLENSKGYWVKTYHAIPEGWLEIAPDDQPEIRNEVLYDSWGNKRTSSFDFVAGVASGLEVDEKVELINKDGEVVIDFYVDGNGFLALTPIYGDDATTHELDGLQIGEELWFRHDDAISDRSIVFEAGKSVHFVELDFESSITSVDDEFMQNIFSVYPNPLMDMGTLDMNIATVLEDATIQLLNMDGKVVKILYRGDLGRGRSTQSFTVNDLASGVYIMQTISDAKVIDYQRLLISK